MKKSLIALAVLAAVTTVAQAQSSVTLYGNFDTSYNNIKLKNIDSSIVSEADSVRNKATAAGILNSTRIGFRGEEYLTDGMKAHFNLEYALSGNLSGNHQASLPQSSDMNGSIQTRTSRIGIISDKLGQLNVGYGTTGIYSTINCYSPIPGNHFIGDIASNIQSNDVLNAKRINGINYITPTINGFSGRVDLGITNGSNSLLDSSNSGVTLNYASGPMSIAASVHQMKDDIALDNKVNFRALSGQYAITDNLAVNALYAQNKLPSLQAKNDITKVGIRYHLGKTALVAQYGEGNSINTSVIQHNRVGYQLGAIYNLSKRTDAYVLYGNQNIKQTNGTSQEKMNGHTIGLRHSF